MDDDNDIRRWMSIFLVVFVLVIIFMIVYFARLVSVFLAKKNPKGISSTVAEQQQEKRPLLESVTNKTLRFIRLCELYLEAPLEVQQRDIGELKKLANERNKEYTQLMKTDPTAALALTFPESLRGELPSELQDLIEERISVEGRIQERNINNENKLVIIDSTGEELGLYFVEGNTYDLSTGEAVHIQGVHNGNNMVVESVRKLLGL